VGNLNLIGKLSFSGRAKGFGSSVTTACLDPELCNEKKGVQLNLLLTGGIELSYIHPNILAVEGQLRGSVTGSFSSECKKPWKGRMCSGPIERRLQVKFLSFLTEQYSDIIEDSFVCSDGGTMTLP